MLISFLQIGKHPTFSCYNHNPQWFEFSSLIMATQNSNFDIKYSSQQKKEMQIFEKL